jgi:hypothetical protein
MRARYWLGLLLVAGGAGAGGYRAGHATPPAPRGSDAALVERLDAIEARLGMLAIAQAPATVRCANVATATATTATGEPVPPRVVPPSQQLSREAEEALAKGNALVDDAIQLGRWGEADAQKLRATLPALPAAEQAQIAQRLFAAINSERVRVDLHGPPL